MKTATIRRNKALERNGNVVQGCVLPMELYRRANSLRAKLGIPVTEQIRRALDLWLKQQEAGR